MSTPRYLTNYIHVYPQSIEYHASFCAILWVSPDKRHISERPWRPHVASVLIEGLKLPPRTTRRQQEPASTSQCFVFKPYRAHSAVALIVVGYPACIAFVVGSFHGGLVCRYHGHSMSDPAAPTAPGTRSRACAGGATPSTSSRSSSSK
jgi:hypothetical protein